MVVRGGINRDANAIVVNELDEAVEAGELPTLCVFADDHRPGEDDAALLLRLCLEGPVRHGQVMVSRVGLLAAAGFTLLDLRTELESYCHYEYSFEGFLTAADVGRWIDCLQLPVPNPGKVRR